MTDPYVAANVPLVRQLATLLDWALVAHVLLAGTIVFFAWRAQRLSARVRELEQTLAELKRSTDDSPQKVPHSAQGEVSLASLSDDKPIPLMSSPKDRTSPSES